MRKQPMIKNLFSGVITGVALLKKGKIMRQFTKKSIIVKSWVSLIVTGVYTYDDVPNLLNLRAVVKEVLDELEKETKEG